MKVILKGSGELRAELSKVKSNMLTRTIMAKLAAAAVTIIVDRTVEQGRDKDGKPFKKYSRGYLELKKERGGKFFSGKPNLFDEGEMIGDLHFKVEGRSKAFLLFPKTDENLKASGHVHGSRNLPKRDFFGLTSDEEKELLLIPKRHLEDLINA